MKKLVTIASIILSLAAVADTPISYSMSNAMAWVGVNINASNVSNLPHRVSSTPGDALLGFFRSYVTNDAEDHFFHLCSASRMRLYGISDINHLSESKKRLYSQTPPDTNLLIRSMSAIASNPCLVVASVDLVETLCSETFDDGISRFHLIYTNEEWKVDLIYEE